MPTVLEALGLPAPSHRLEGRSLLPLLPGAAPEGWRETSYSELDYGFREARLILGKGVHDCRGYSLRSARWRYVYWLGEREQLWDLQADPPGPPPQPHHGQRRAGGQDHRHAQAGRGVLRPVVSAAAPGLVPAQASVG